MKFNVSQNKKINAYCNTLIHNIKEKKTYCNNKFDKLSFLSCDSVEWLNSILLYIYIIVTYV